MKVLSRQIIQEDVIERTLHRRTQQHFKEGVNILFNAIFVEAFLCRNREVIGLLEATKNVGHQTWTVHSIMVKQSERRKGIATMLWKELSEKIKLVHSNKLTDLGIKWIEGMDS